MAHYEYKRVRDVLIDAGWIVHTDIGLTPADKEEYGEEIDNTYDGNLYEMAADYMEELAKRLQASEARVSELKNKVKILIRDDRGIREYLAISHEDGKCHTYTDDGELQCGNMQRHGRCIDFAKESIASLLKVIRDTRWKELAENPDFPEINFVKQKPESPSKESK